MTTHVPVPADIEAEALAELIADAAQIPLPRPRFVDLTAVPRQCSVINIPDTTISLVEEYADYGC